MVGGLADRVGRVKILMWGFILGIAGSLLVGIAISAAVFTALSGGYRVDHAHGSPRPQTRRQAMNALINEFTGKLETIKGWRHHLHKHPELSLEERKTAKYIADLVRSWGYDVVEGIGKHGVVASLTAGQGTRSIGLRADTDALPIQEDNDLPYKSEITGVAHLCGHDGHTAMLLAAGEYLARSRNFSGTVRLIFQPAEEITAGGPAMIEDGLFERWPVDAVFGMHNMPGARDREAAFSRRRDDGGRGQLGDRVDR